MSTVRGDTMPEKTPAQKRAQKAYMDKFARIEIRMLPAERDALQAHAAARGESAHAFLQRAIQETIERDKESAGD